jgi:uncharacterized membrane protein YesL
MFTGYMGIIYTISNWIIRLAYVNILWIAFTLLGLIILGFFPATAAMFAVIRKWVLGNEDNPVFRTFWTVYRKEFLKSNLLGIFLSSIGYFLYIDYLLISEGSNNFIQLFHYPLLIIILLYLLTILFVFPIYVHYDLKLFQVIKNSLITMIISPFITLIMIIASFVVYLLLSTFPGLLPLFGGSLLAFLLTRSFLIATNRIERIKKMNTNKNSIHL